MVHQINIFIHVVTGILALLIGIIPLISAKGGNIHKRFGKIFLVLMLVVIVTAVIGLIFYRNRPFLIVLTMMAAYQAFTGLRAIQTKENGPGKGDFLFSLLCFSYGLVFAWQLPSLNPEINMATIYYALFFLFMIMVYDMTRFVIKSGWNPKQLWLYEHIYKMIGAYTGLLSAFTGTVIVGWEPYNTIIPSTLGFLLIIVFIIKQAKSTKKSVQSNKISN